MDRLILQLSALLITRFKEELRGQGHSLTGKLEESIQAATYQLADRFILSFSAENYGGYLNEGVPAERIPFGRRKTGARTSLFIQALIVYVQRRMNLVGKEAVGVAFAIAHVQKEKGMPTPGSYRYAQNNRRTKWVDTVVTASEAEIVEIYESFFETTVEALFKNFYNEYN